jgi:hypothetical protein
VRSLSRCFTVSFALVLLGSVALAQPAVPTAAILTRTRMVQSQYGRASIFSIDVDQREYWVTAKHVVSGRRHPPYGVIADKSIALRILNPSGEGEQWLSETFSVIDPGDGIDIVVLAAAKPILHNPVPSLPTGANQLFLGGDCEFLGFPYGSGWRAGTGTQSFWMPYVKHCTVSSFWWSSSPDSKRVWVLDGINNEGFSGGPVIFGTGLQQKIFAVVSGYHTEPAEVVPYDAARRAPEKKHRDEPSSQPFDDKAHGREKVNVNSGFIVAFDIEYAVDAIKKNPIGPLRSAK